MGAKRGWGGSDSRSGVEPLVQCLRQTVFLPRQQFSQLILQRGPRRANHRVTEDTENNGTKLTGEMQAVEHMAVQLSFAFSVSSVTRWLERKPAMRI